MAAGGAALRPGGPRGGAIQPAALALPGVGRQGNRPAAALLEAPPGDGLTPDVEGGEGAQERVPPGLAPAQGGEHDALGVVVAEARGQRRRQDRMRAELQEAPVALPDQRAHRVGEEHRPPRLPAPVSDVPLLPAGGRPGERRDERDGGGARGEPAQRGREPVEELLDPRAVEGIGGGQDAAEDLALPQPREEHLQGLRIAGDHHRARRVDRGDGEPVLEARELAPALFGRELDLGHPPSGRGALEQAPALDGEAHGLVQAEHPRQVRRRDLAGAVAHDRAGLHAPVAPERRQGDLEGQEDGLGDLGVEQTGALLGRFQLGEERPAGQAGHEAVALLQRGAEDRLLGRQIEPHARVLRPLAGEHEHRSAGLFLGLSRRQPRVRLAAQEGLQAGPRLGAVPRHHRQAVAVMRPPAGAESEVRDRRLFPGRIQEVEDRPRPLRERHGEVGRERQQEGRRRRLRPCRRVRRPLQDDVGVGAAEAEGADAGQRGTPGPGRQLRLHRERQLVERDVRVRLLEVQAGRDLPVPERERDLDQAGDAGGRFQVPDVGLHRAQGAAVARRAPLRQDAAQAPWPRSGRRAACRCRGPRRTVPRPGETPARRQASRSTASWARRLGAVRPFVRPSWLTALPRITA